MGSLLHVAHVLESLLNIGRKLLVDEFTQAALVAVLGEGSGGHGWCGHVWL